MIRTQLTTPLPPTHRTLIPPTIQPKIMYPLTPTPDIHWENANSPPTLSTQWKSIKRRKIKLLVMLQSTTPWPWRARRWYRQFFHPIFWIQQRLSLIFIEKSKTCPLLQQHHEKPQKQGKEINDKVTIDTTHPPNAPGSDNPNDSNQNAGSTHSFLSYSLINCYQYCKISPNTKNTWPPTLMLPMLIPPILLTMMLRMPLIMMAMLLFILNGFTFTCAISITIAKSPPTPKY